jgi:hypothetical protein
MKRIIVQGAGLTGHLVAAMLLERFDDLELQIQDLEPRNFAHLAASVYAWAPLPPMKCEAVQVRTVLDKFEGTYLDELYDGLDKRKIAADLYRRKVYGDFEVPDVSITKLTGTTSVSYRLDPTSLPSLIPKDCFLFGVKPEEALERAADLVIWTSYLPQLLKLLRIPTSEFHSIPIGLDVFQEDKSTLGEHEIEISYHPTMLEEYYRKTRRHKTVAKEYSLHGPLKDRVFMSTIRPGKLVPHPYVDKIVQRLKEDRGIVPLGRYAEWKPKLLLHQIHERVSKCRHLEDLLT